MENILQELQKKKCWKSFLKTQCRRNHIDPAISGNFTIIKIRKFYDKPQSIQLSDKPRKKSSVWLQNELKAYQWFLIALSGCKQLLIEQFSSIEWEQLSNIFGKQQRVLQYEAVKLISQRKNLKRKWEQQESDILFNIIREDPNTNKWNQIARKLFDVSNKQYFRSGKQCREQWLNHLDPNKKHGEWETTEDRFIAQYILNKGKKWSDISKLLQNQRTEHMIKNRYKTIIIRLRKSYKNIKNQGKLLRIMLGQETTQNGMKNDSKEQKKQLELEGLPIMESGEQDQNQQFQIQDKDNQMNDRLNFGSYKDCDFQQVATPCPMIIQTFTPTFLNTPHALPFFNNFSFGKFDKNDSLFLNNK